MSGSFPKLIPDPAGVRPTELSTSLRSRLDAHSHHSLSFVGRPVLVPLQCSPRSKLFSAFLSLHTQFTLPALDLWGSERVRLGVCEVGSRTEDWGLLVNT